MKKTQDWWKLPSVIAGVVIALGAIGTGIVKTARFLSVPDRVEAAEQKNVEQDKAIDKIATILQIQQQMQQQQQQQTQDDWYWCERCGKAGEWRQKPPKPTTPP